jgi:hypothetical protein
LDENNSFRLGTVHAQSSDFHGIIFKTLLTSIAN